MTECCADKKTRDKAVKSLAIFLSDPDRDALPSAEMAKLWRGIFYCEGKKAACHNLTLNQRLFRLLDVGQTFGAASPFHRACGITLDYHICVYFAGFSTRILEGDCATMEWN